MRKSHQSRACKPRRLPDALPFDPVVAARRHWVEHGWAAAADGMAAITSLMRARQIVLAQVDAVLQLSGLNFPRYEMLMLLLFSRAGQLPMTKIGVRLQVHPTSVTNGVDRLEAAGLVARTPHPTDRRATLIDLTPSGRTVALQATRALNSTVFSEPGVTQQESKELFEILASMRSSAGDFGPADPADPN